MTAPAAVSRGKSNGRAPTAAAPATPLPTEGYQLLRVDQVDVGENVRVQPGELDELAASIAEHGVLQPVKVVGPHPDGRYRLVWGQRRLLASVQAGRDFIPAIVQSLTTSEEVDRPGAKRSIEQLVENLQRADLNPIDEARALRQVLDADPELTQAELAKRLGRSESWVANVLRLLGLAAGVQELVADGKLTQSHAKAIAGLANEKSQVDIAENAVKYDYSAKQVEAQVSYRKQSDRSEPDRAEQLRKKGERLAKKMVKALETDGIPKDAQLVLGGLWDVDETTVRKALVKVGYQGASAKRDPVGSYGYKPDEIGCDCSAYRWDTYPAAGFRRCCVSQAHVEAFQAKEESAESQRKKEVRDKAKRLTAVLATGLAGIDPTAARLVVAAFHGSNFTHNYGAKADPWTRLEAVSPEVLAHELAELVASRLIPTEHWGRTDDSAGLAAAINKLAAAPAKKPAEASA